MQIEELLLHMIDQDASDLHLTAGQPPELRIFGELTPTEFDLLKPEDIKELVYGILSPEQIRILEQTKELDASFGLKDISRFRLNVHFQRGSMAAAIRRISYEIPTMDELCLPPIIKKFTERNNGLFLVTGPAGSGKSTTLASMIEYINQSRKSRIITIEDPIEYLHRHKRSTIIQREVGEDTLSYTASLKHVLRQDPNIILVGEMRDLETMQAVLTLAETGHLVLSTLHTRNTTHAINRIVDVFPSYHQQQVRVQLSMVLIGVISQQLLPRKSSHGLALAYELMNVTPSIRNLIRENILGQIYSFLQTGSEHGMSTMNYSLAKLYKENIVKKEDVLQRSDDLRELRSLIEI